MPAQTIEQQQTNISEIPQNVVKDVVSWLAQELTKAQGERSDLDQKLVRWERMYEAVPAQPVKSFPWPGASNLEIPTIATAVESVHSRIMNSIFGPKDVWSAVARSPEWAPIVDDVSRWLNWVGREVLNLKPIVMRWVLSTCKFGTGVLKETWRHSKKKVTSKGVSGGTQTDVIDTHFGPMLSTIPLPDFYISNDAIFSGDIQSCEWVMERQLYTYKQLKALETSGIFQNVDLLKNDTRTVSTDMEEETSKNVGISVSEYKDYELWEAYCSYDIDNDGYPEELCIVFDPKTYKVVKATLNDSYNQERPYKVIRYMIRDNSFWGIGVCQMLDPIQTEISSIHNRRLDNATLANTSTFTRVRGSKTGPLEWYPGAVWDVGARGDIEPLEMGHAHVTLLPEELNTGAIGEKRTGVNDYTVGRESAAIGSRATATSTLALIKEGNVRFKAVIDEVRDALTDIGHQTIQLYQQHAEDAKVYYEMFSAKNQPAIKTFLTLPAQLSRAGVLIDVPAISEVYNKDVNQQTNLTLMQVMQQFYSGIMQAFQLALNPQAPQEMRALAVQGAQSASKIWRRVLESFDITDSDSFAPDIDTLLGIQSVGEQIGQGTQVGSTPSGAGQPPMATPVDQNAGTGLGQPGQVAGGVGPTNNSAAPSGY
jgi:hypothetical protein